MSLYFGIPVTCKEAYRLFNLDYKETNCSYDYEQIDKINIFFTNEKMNMRLFCTDKGQCIIGYKIKEVRIFEIKFINVDQFIIKLTNLKTLFAIETKKYNNNFEKVELEHMEDDPEFVSFPEPYIIEFNG